MTLNIKDKEVTLKKTMRSFIIYESITGKAFTPQNMTDIITYFYSVVLASDKSLECTFDDFIDLLDDDETLLPNFQQWIIDINERDTQLSKKKTTTKKAAKKTN